MRQVDPMELSRAEEAEAEAVAMETGIAPPSAPSHGAALRDPARSEIWVYDL